MISQSFYAAADKPPAPLNLQRISEKYQPLGMNRCHLCSGDFFAPSLNLLLFYINRVHSSSPDFNLTRRIDNCQVTFTNFHAFKRHIRKKHRSHLNDIETDGSLGDQLYAYAHCEEAITTGTGDEASSYATNSEANSEVPTTDLDRERAVAFINKCL